MAYVTNVEAAAFLGLDSGNAVIMDDLTAKIIFAESLVDDFCNTSFAYNAVASAKTFDGSGTDILNLTYPLAALTSIAIVDNTGTVSTTYTSTDFSLRPANSRTGIYRFIQAKDPSVRFPKGIQNVKITGTWGFATVPSTFKLAIYLTLKNIYDVIAREAGISKEREFGREIWFNLKANDLIPPMAKMILQQHTFINKLLNEE